MRLRGTGPGEEGAGTVLEETPRKVQLLLPASSGCRGLLRAALKVCKEGGVLQGSSASALRHLGGSSGSAPCYLRALALLLRNEAFAIAGGI